MRLPGNMQKYAKTKSNLQDLQKPCVIRNVETSNRNIIGGRLRVCTLYESGPWSRGIRYKDRYIPNKKNNSSSGGAAVAMRNNKIIYHFGTNRGMLTRGRAPLGGCKSCGLRVSGSNHATISVAGSTALRVIVLGRVLLNVS